MPTSAMKACFQIAERSLSYAKIMPASAMKACFQIAERSLSYAKILIFADYARHYGKFLNFIHILRRQIHIFSDTAPPHTLCRD